MHKYPGFRAASVAGFAVVTLILATGCGSGDDVDAASSTVTAHAYSLNDNSDVRVLMASATHVFTGQVLEVSGTKELSANPETQFAVKTGVVLKGDVPDRVTVNQGGGVSNGVYTSIEGDKPLEVGQWYRFATKYLPSEDWYSTIAVYGNVPISEEEALDESSRPVAEAIAALEQNPQGRLDLPPTTAPEPTLTFPIPSPGDDNPIPSSPAPPASSQPTG